MEEELQDRAMVFFLPVPFVEFSALKSTIGIYIFSVLFLDVSVNFDPIIITWISFMNNNLSIM